MTGGSVAQGSVSVSLVVTDLDGTLWHTDDHVPEATLQALGALEAAGPLGQLTPHVSPGYGFAAIIVAFA